MKCPYGTVEVSVWTGDIYFDNRKNATEMDHTVARLVPGDGYYDIVWEALGPFMALSGPALISQGGQNIYLFTPEEFESITEHIP